MSEREEMVKACHIELACFRQGVYQVRSYQSEYINDSKRELRKVSKNTYKKINVSATQTF